MGTKLSKMAETPPSVHTKILSSEKNVGIATVDPSDSSKTELLIPGGV